MADNKEVLSCPACDKQMSKVYDKNTKIYVDICLDGCGGMFFDNRELEKFDFPGSDADVLMSVTGKRSFAETDESKIRKCPLCGTPMVKMGAADGLVQIDVCNVCGGKFLDHNELKKIREYNSGVNSEEKVDALMKELYKVALSEGELLNLDSDAKNSKRRQFFEDITKKFI